jgi:hypothetical protein
MFCLGIVAVGRWAIGYIMLLEFVTEGQKKILGSVAQAAGAMPLLIGTLIAYTSKNTMYIQVTLLVINGVTLTIIFFFMTESPKFLYSNERYEECR